MQDQRGQCKVVDPVDLLGDFHLPLVISMDFDQHLESQLTPALGKGPYELNATSLLQYIVSFRDECHFHEEICETIYKRLYDLTNPEELMVSCLYVRRGGIDINPIRANSQELLKQNWVMWDRSKYFPKTVRQ